jgi:Ca2+-binding protein (EF-Hand superfamily)
MKRTILTAIAAAAMSATPLLAQEDDLFAKLDANKDGVVTADEVQGDAKGLFERALRRGDKDGDKKLTKEEFAAAQKESDAPRQPLAQGGGPGRPGGGQFNPREIFARLDTNKDGKISKDEAQGPFKENFDRFDANKDGFIGEDEIGRLGGGGQFNPREIFARQDANKDGKVSKDEAQGFLKEGFDRLDANSDGAISEEELARTIGRRTDGVPGAPGAGNRPNPEQLAAMFDRLDANKDGKLTKDEVPEGQREPFTQLLERLGSDSLGKDQFPRFMALMAQFGRPGEGRPGVGRPGQPGPGGPAGFGRPPLIVALDADNDGELSASEIEAASKALLKLDKNSDGKLTREELFPGPPDGPPRDRPGEGRPGDRPGQPQPDARRPGEGRPGLAGRFNAEEYLARLKEADKNGDGQISKDEAPPMLKERFDRIDANGDGQLDQTELKQMLQRREGGGDRPQGRPEGRRPNGDRPDAPKRE